MLAIFVAFLFLLAIIPRWGSEGVKLLRTASIFERLESYSDATLLTSKSPVFGIGYNNLCIAKGKFLGKFVQYDSHACSGVESGPLLILATSGIVGFLVFLKMVLAIYRNVTSDIYGTAFIGASVAIAVHGIFANSYFYPWVMGFLAILLSLSLKKN